MLSLQTHVLYLTRVKCVDKVIHFGHLLTENVYELNMLKCVDDLSSSM